MTELIERLFRRVQMMVGRGRITTGDDSGNAQRLQVQLGADEVRDNTWRLAEFGFASMPPNGSDAIVIFPAGDRSSGVIIATSHQTFRLKNLGSGEAALYDAFGKYIKLAKSGITIEANNTPVVIQNASEVDLIGAGGTAKGIVQADCLCAFTGQPHPMVSSKIKGSM